MWSLKSRLLIGMAGGMAALLIVFNLIIYHSISHALFKQFDVSLQSAAQMLSASVELDKNTLGLEFDVAMVPEFTGKRSAYYEFWRNDGVAMGKSPSLGQEDIIQFHSGSRLPSFKSFIMQDGQPVRAVAVKFMPRSEKDEPNVAQQSFTLVVAKDAARLLAQLQRLKYLLFMASIGSIGIAGFIAAVVVGRGLKPLNKLALQIGNIKEGNLSTRISGEHIPSEIVPIQNRLNSLLFRLEASFSRERTFNANVAHELRTPLAGIRSIIDVALMRERDTAEYRNALTDCLAVSIRMQTMVDNLLMLARVESGQMTFEKEPVKVAELVDVCWRPFFDKALQHGLTFENHVNTDWVYQSDAGGLSMIFSNLLDNAAEYTNKGGRICVTARTTNGNVEIVFENTGNQLTSQQADEIFECFWRGDSARTGAGIHCGLGLAMVKRIVESLGGSARAGAQNDIFSVTLTLS
jgi:signal transduction histidine kinase